MKGKRLKEFNNYTFVPVSFYKDTFDENFTMAAHCHQYLEMMYCKKGKFNINLFPNSTDDESPFAITLSERQFILLDAGVLHTLTVPSGTATVYNVEWEISPLSAAADRQLVRIDVSAFFRLLNGLKSFTENEKPYVVSVDSENLEYVLSRYIDSLHHGATTLADQCGTKAQLIQLLLELDSCLLAKKTGNILYVKRAQEYIRTNFMNDISTDDVAEFAGVHKVYLQRLFKAHLGIPVMQAVNRYRVQKCKQLLLETNWKLDEIALHVGFHNRHHLIYEFKSLTGESPSEYKEKQLNGSYRMAITDEYRSLDEQGNPIN